MFKVVADQLRISEGWVRCGHCQQVFDASAHLQPALPPALMPDMALDKMRPPPQPVPRTEPPARAWGAPASRPLPVPAEKPQAATPSMAEKASEPAIEPGRAMKTLQFPESAVPAFLAADPAPPAVGREMSGLMQSPLPPLPWVAPSDLPSLDPPVTHAPAMEWPTIEFSPEPLPMPRPMGYELPAPLLNEGDGEGVEPGPDPEPTDSGPRETEAASAAQDPPTDSDLHEALNEVLARRSSLPPAPEVELEKQALFQRDHATPEQLQPFPSTESELPVDAQPEVVPDPPAPKGVLAEKDHGSSSAEQAATESDQDALTGELSFVRAARRKAFWRKTSVRLGLVLLGLVLLCGLLLQAAVHERRWIVATWPPVRPYLEQLCGPLQCELGPYRQIAAVVVDGSTFHKTRTDQYQFSLTLKNRSETSVEMPAIELTLTDAQDQPVLRRVLAPQDLAAPAELTAQSESNLAATLVVNLGNTRITGYRVLAFYP